MKLLLLNPKIDSEHKIAEGMVAKGAAILFPADVSEAWQLLQLHGTSVELGIFHLEDLNGATTETLKLIEKIKNDPFQADLPIVLTTDTWSDEQCLLHQSSPYGVNAYLHSPFGEDELLNIIHAVLGHKLGAKSVPLPYTDPDGNVAGGLTMSSIQIGSGKDIEEGDSAPDPEGFTIGFGRDELSSAPLQVGFDLTSVLDAKKLAEIRNESKIEPKIEIKTEQRFEPTFEPKLESSVKLDSANKEDKDVDKEVAQEMPYLFPEGKKKSLLERISEKFKGSEAKPDISEPGSYQAPSSEGGASPAPGMIFGEPLGNAVVPGGAAHTPDLETFKKYLLLREQDVAVLSNQLKAAHDQSAMVDQLLRTEKAKNAELTHIVNEQRHKIDDFGKEKELALENLQVEVNDLRFHVKAKTDKARVLESQVRDITDEMERLKERVRTDIRKIRVREKELENRLEIMKKDSEALIGARENKIIELKRKLDLLEFNMDLLQDQYSREKENTVTLKERLAKAAQVVRVAGGLLDSSKEATGKEKGSPDPIQEARDLNRLKSS